MLTGKDDSGNLKPYHLGHFFIAIDTEAFMGLETFKKISGDILRELRNSEKAPGQERIYTAGEKEYLIWQERKDKGVPLNQACMKDIKTVNMMLGLNKKLPF
jgi:LDH2 family malate/lactate/ureidoglycolate dehydrogenase